MSGRLSWLQEEGQTGWAWFGTEEQNKSPVTETLKDTMSRK